jgi:hypothetical protein
MVHMRVSVSLQQNCKLEKEGEEDTKTTVTSDMLGVKQEEEEQTLQAWLLHSLAAIQSILPSLNTQGQLGQLKSIMNRLYS